MKYLKLILPKLLDMCKKIKYIKVRNFRETNCPELKKISKYKELTFPYTFFYKNTLCENTEPQIT